MIPHKVDVFRVPEFLYLWAESTGEHKQLLVSVVGSSVFYIVKVYDVEILMTEIFREAVDKYNEIGGTK